MRPRGGDGARARTARGVGTPGRRLVGCRGRIGWGLGIASAARAGATGVAAAATPAARRTRRRRGLTGRIRWGLGIASRGSDL